MNKIRLVLTIIASIVVCSCQKTELIQPTASLNIVNVTAPDNLIIPRLGPDMSGRYFSVLPKVGFGGCQLYAPVSGLVPIVVVPSTDSALNLFQGNLNLIPGAIYSLFFSGDSASPDTLLTRDYFPVFTDSAAGVRFINLSLGSNEVTINLVGDDPGNLQFPALAYRQVSLFKTYPATKDVGGSYQFEIRNKISGNVLQTYQWNYKLLRNHTIIIAGSTDPSNTTNPLSIFCVNNY